MHHLPYGKKWDPTQLAEILTRDGIPASVDDLSVRIEVPGKEHRSIFTRLFRLSSMSPPFIVTVRHEPSRFIRNIEVQYDPLDPRIDRSLLHSITDALRECGYIIKSDRDIAAIYCAHSDELTSWYESIERLQQQKEQFVAMQDFEAARRVRDEEYSIRDKIDAYLFKVMA